MSMSIAVQHVCKTFHVPVREAGLSSAIKSLWKRNYRDVAAVNDITFSIDEGEIVGFLGPNGAGKTTTLKMLAGLLYPTSGEIRVAGFTPYKREPAYLRRISMVMGNKSQLSWDLPAKDSFYIIAEIYRVPRDVLQKTLDELIALLDLSDLLTKQIRMLSLGERMKCELVAALLYRPRVLFLDEPTLGLDVSMQSRLRRFIAEYNQLSGATILLTSHYMADVVALCSRVIVINHGQMIYDGNLRQLTERYAPTRLVRLELDEEALERCQEVDFPSVVEVIAKQHTTWTLSLPQTEVPAITAQLLQTLPIVDLSVEEPPIETVIDTLFQGGRA